MLDSHCHIDRYKIPQAVAAEAAKRNVFVIAVTNLPSHFQMGVPHARKLKNVRLALGLHPLAEGDIAKERELFRDLLSQTSYVGEVGLDFSREGIATRDRQIETFRFIAECLSPLKKVVSLHSRKAESAVLDILSEYRVGPVIFHWFSGPLSVMDVALRKGHYFSVNPAMLQSEAGQRIIARVSPDRLLTESDGPHVKIGRRHADPWDVKLVEDYLSALWQLDTPEVSKRIWSNFRNYLERAGIMPEATR